MYASESLVQATRAEAELMKRRFKSKVWDEDTTARALMQCREQLARLNQILRVGTSDVLVDQALEMALVDVQSLHAWAQENNIPLLED